MILCDDCYTSITPDNFYKHKKCVKTHDLNAMDGYPCKVHPDVAAVYNICPGCTPDLDVYTTNLKNNYLADSPEFDGEGQMKKLLCISVGSIVDHTNDDHHNNDNDSSDIDNDIKMIRKTYWRHNITYVKLATPPGNVKPYEFLNQNIAKIVNEIQTHPHLSKNKNYKVTLSYSSKFRKQNEGADTHEDRILHDTTHVRTLLNLTHSFNASLLKDLLDSVDLRFDGTMNKFQGSGWLYVSTSDIALTFIRFKGRNVNYQKDIGCYVAYPDNTRGARKIINIFNDPRDKLLDPYYGPEQNRCVTLCLKAHFINHDDNLPLRTDIIDELKIGNRHLSKNANEALYAKQVIYPDNIIQNTFTVKDFAKLEKANKTPIVVYSMLANKSHKKEGLFINCIRAPKQRVLNRYRNKATCHILMLSPSHCAYIPNMTDFMNTIFKKNNSHRRCHLCFGLLSNKQSLDAHLRLSTCFGSYSQPPVTNLKSNGKLKYLNLMNDVQPDMICIMDTESILKKAEITNQNSQSDGETSDYEDFQDVIEQSADQFYENMTSIREGEIPNDVNKDPNIINTHQPISYGAVYLDHNREPIKYSSYFGEDTGEQFLQRVTEDIKNVMDMVASEKCFKAYLTYQEFKDHTAAKKCMYCQNKFKNNKDKHTHHDHHIQGEEQEYSYFNKRTGKTVTKKRVIKSNYVGPACKRCNWQITGKRRRAVCIFHNGSQYDLPLLMRGMCSDKSKIKDIKLLPKGANSYYNVKFSNASFIDSCSFLSAPLDTLVKLLCSNIDEEEPEKTIPITVKMVKDKNYDHKLLKYVSKKGVYPYELANSCQEMENIKEWPPEEAFYNRLKGCHIEKVDYDRGKEMWDIANCKNLKDLHDLYLLLDVCLLADIWVWFTETMIKDFELNPANFLTGPSFVMKAALKLGKTDIELIDDMELYNTWEGLLRGGFCNVNQRLVNCNNVDMGHLYNDKDPDVFFMFIDFNSLYAEALTKPLPYRNFQKCDPTVFTKEYIMDINTTDTATTGYLLNTSIKIPSDLRKYCDDLPLGLINTSKIVPSPHTQDIGGHGGQEKLVGTHYDLSEYSFHVKLLQFYLSIGCELTNVHSVWSFDQKPIFKEYIDFCIKRRKENMDVPVLKQLYKLLCNSLYGKTIMSDRKYNTNTRLVTLGEALEKACSDPKFQSYMMVAPDVAAVTNNKAYIDLQSPIFMGATVLQLAKLKNYNFHYNVAKISGGKFGILPGSNILEEDRKLIMQSREVIDSIELCYCDTDSLGYKIQMNEQRGKGRTQEWLCNNTFLKNYLDRSNFKHSDDKTGGLEPGALGLLKSEVGDSIVHQAIFLSPKCYSIESHAPVKHKGESVPLDRANFKQATKGVPSHVSAEVYTHEEFQKIIQSPINEYECPEAVGYHFRKKNANMYTSKYTKTALTLFDNKRFWLNRFTSLGYGHPDIDKNQHKLGDILTHKGGYISGTKDMVTVTPDDVEDDNQMDHVEDDDSLYVNTGGLIHSAADNNQPIDCEVDDDELIHILYHLQENETEEQVQIEDEYEMCIVYENSSCKGKGKGKGKIKSELDVHTPMIYYEEDDVSDFEDFEPPQKKTKR